MNSIKTKLPKESMLFADRAEYDYEDSFQYTIKVSPSQMDILAIGRAFSQPGPKWFKMLFSLRNKIAKLVHLKTPDITTEGQQENDQWEIGKKAGIFTFYAKTEHELILGDDDKHLNFRVSLFMSTRHTRVFRDDSNSKYRSQTEQPAGKDLLFLCQAAPPNVRSYYHGEKFSKVGICKAKVGLPPYTESNPTYSIHFSIV
jgi:Protein of unknown function (DUF2867).